MYLSLCFVVYVSKDEHDGCERFRIKSYPVAMLNRFFPMLGFWLFVNSQCDKQNFSVWMSVTSSNNPFEYLLNGFLGDCRVPREQRRWIRLFGCRGCRRVYLRRVVISWSYTYIIISWGLTHLCLASNKRNIGKSVDPDQTPQNAASDQGLHCLQLGQESL